MPTIHSVYLKLIVAIKIVIISLKLNVDLCDCYYS